MNTGGIYFVFFSPAARRDIKSLPLDVVRRIDPKILDLARDPRPIGCSKIQGSADTYRIRAGDFRIVYTVDDQLRRVTLTIIAHRRESYRGL